MGFSLALIVQRQLGEGEQRLYCSVYMCESLQPFLLLLPSTPSSNNLFKHFKLDAAGGGGCAANQGKQQIQTFLQCRI